MRFFNQQLHGNLMLKAKPVFETMGFVQICIRVLLREGGRERRQDKDKDSLISLEQTLFSENKI